MDALIGIHEETLPFHKDYFRILKNMMIEEQTDSYIFKDKNRLDKRWRERYRMVGRIC